MNDHPLGCVGWPPKPLEMRIVEDGEIQFRGPSLTPGYWNDPEATQAAFTEDGWYMSGDLGAYDDGGPAPPPRAQEGHHRPAQRLQRVPRGPRERAPGRGHPRLGGDRDQARADRGRRARARDARGAGRPRATPAIETASPEDVRREIDAAVKAANALARAEPADRGLARVARGRLPAHPHVQGQARPGPGLGGDQRAAAGDRGRVVGRGAGSGRA